MHRDYITSNNYKSYICNAQFYLMKYFQYLHRNDVVFASRREKTRILGGRKIISATWQYSFTMCIQYVYIIRIFVCSNITNSKIQFNNTKTSIWFLLVCLEQHSLGCSDIFHFLEQRKKIYRDKKKKKNVLRSTL